MGVQRSRICVAADDATLRRRIHSALVGVAHEMGDLDCIADPSSVRRVGDESLLVVVGSRIGRAELTPAALARVRALEPLVPIIMCLLPTHPLLKRLGDLALAGVDRVVLLDAPDEAADLRSDVREALKHILPLGIDLGVDTSVLSRGSAIELWCARQGYLRLSESTVARRFVVDRTQCCMRSLVPAGGAFIISSMLLDLCMSAPS